MGVTKTKAEGYTDFLDNETAQEVAVLFAIRWDYQFLSSNNDGKFIGNTVEGIVLTESGLIASMHLVGNGKTHDALNGFIPWSEAKDGYGTSALKYVEEMGGLDLSMALGGIK